MPVGQHLSDHFLVALHALHLVERTFVVIQSQPGHAVENGLHRLGRRALHVGVLDAQDERAAVTAGEGPRKQRGAGAADVQVAGGAGSETGANGVMACGIRS